MKVGIDLGTTFSAVAYVDDSGKAQIIPNRDGDRTTPSVVLFEDGVPIVGKEAKANSVTDSLNVSQFVKRQMGDKSFHFDTESGESFSAEDISAIILKKLKSDAEAFLGKEISEAVITVPAYFSDAQRKATQDAGKIAGINVTAIINEPTAAALSYGLSKENFQGNILVYDLGGGTFDVTVMSITPESIKVLATLGDKNLGGFDFDNLIVDYASREFLKQTGADINDDDNAMQDLREKAESAKKALSAKARTTIAVFSEGKSVKIELTKEQFEEMASGVIGRTEVIIGLAMEDSGLKWKDIDKILLVGGSTRIPAVQLMITNVSGGIMPSLDINPDEAVALGAAYYANAFGAGQMAGDRVKVSNTEIVDVNPHSLGVVLVDNDTNKLFNEIVLKRNTSLPAEGTTVTCTMEDNQKYWKVSITEGEDEDLEYVTTIGESVIKLTGNRPKGSPNTLILYYDLNGIVHVKVIDGVDNSDLGEFQIKRKANLTDEEINDKMDRMSKFKID